MKKRNKRHQANSNESIKRKKTKAQSSNNWTLQIKTTPDVKTN
jgi:hypothetical protein